RWKCWWRGRRAPTPTGCAAAPGTTRRSTSRASHVPATSRWSRSVRPPAPPWRAKTRSWPDCPSDLRTDGRRQDRCSRAAGRAALAQLDLRPPADSTLRAPIHQRLEREGPGPRRREILEKLPEPRSARGDRNRIAGYTQLLHTDGQPPLSVAMKGPGPPPVVP